MTEASKAGIRGTPSLEVLYRDYAPRVYRLTRRLLGNAADAEDVVQDSFLQAQRKLATFRGESALSTWLYRLAVNAALAYRRRRAARERGRVREKENNAVLERGAHLLPHSLPDPQQQTLDRERQRLVDEAIVRLPAEQREVVALADLEELPLNEVAHRLTLSLPAVKSRLHRGRERLREQLAQNFEEPSPESKG